MEQKQNTAFLPMTQEEMRARGWEAPDIVLVTGDAYVDHPSFGTAIISRLLEQEDLQVAILSQPAFDTEADFHRFGKPKYGFFVTGGNVDSMVAHYSVAKNRRKEDEYTPGGKAGKRPDRALTVYCQLAKKAYPDAPLVIGGLEGSLRRFAHYDYWQDRVMPSILTDTGADLLVFGMGEHQVRAIARRLLKGETPKEMRNIPGTAFLSSLEELPPGHLQLASYEKLAKPEEKLAYAKASQQIMDNQDPLSGKTLVQKQTGEQYLVQLPPSLPLGRKELDGVYALPYTRRWHPAYDALGGVPGFAEVEFSVTHNRGCFGGCNFCAITLHQGKWVSSRSIDSCVEEAKLLTAQPGFKGYIHDVGGPTADFRQPACGKKEQKGMCAGRKCLVPTPCPHLNTGHDEYLELLRRIRTLPKVKKVFVRSGLRYDYIMADKDDTFFKELVQHHVSGQLKVAPEHASPRVLRAMGKPPIEVFDKFADRFYTLTKQVGKEQYLVPYLISSHPGSTLQDAAELALWLHKNRLRPEQVQDFYPTPGTVSTATFYTGLDPATQKPIYVPKDPEEKAMQRALLQYFEPRNRGLVEKALRKAGREELLPVLLGDGRSRVSGTVANPKAPDKDKGAAPIAKAPTFFSSNKKNKRVSKSVGGSSLASSHSTSSSSRSPGFQRGKTGQPAGAALKGRGREPGKGRGAGR